MTTAKNYTTRLRLSRSPATAALVASVRDRLREQQRQRVIAIGRSVSGGAFQVTAPVASDPAVERWVAEGSQTCGCRWTGDYSSVEPAEKIGEDISRHPFLY